MYGASLLRQRPISRCRLSRTPSWTAGPHQGSRSCGSCVVDACGSYVIGDGELSGGCKDPQLVVGEEGLES